MMLAVRARAATAMAVGAYRLECDLAIVGSGFGGAVLALRAAQAGLRVVVLERGRRIGPREFEQMAAGEIPIVHVDRGQPRAGMSRRGPGLVEIRRMRGLTGVVGCAVGGGSQHYTSVTVPAPDEIFHDGWPVDYTAESMRGYFERVSERLRPSPIPSPAAQTAALEALAARLGVPATRLPLAVDWRPPHDEADGAPDRSATAGARGWRHGVTGWLRGNGGAHKRTLDPAYLGEAEARGAQIRPLHRATRIVPQREGYRVEFIRPEAGCFRRADLLAHRLVLAAGTFGTARLLLEARDLHRTLPEVSRALGRRFSTNGDDGALLVGPRVALGNAPAPPATAWLDYWPSDRLFLMELGPLPIWRKRLASVLPALLRRRDGGQRDAAPCVWIIGAMGDDRAPGQLRLDRHGRMRYVRTGDDGGASVRARQRLAELAQAAGATLLRSPNLPFGKQLVTVHPLGGCALADSPERGVCDPYGEVFGYPNLYIADGSVLPTATGGPPSMTIAALAERVAEGMIRRW